MDGWVGAGADGGIGGGRAAGDGDSDDGENDSTDDSSIRIFFCNFLETSLGENSHSVMKLPACEPHLISQ